MEIYIFSEFTPDSYVQSSIFLIKTFHGRVSGFKKKKTLNQNSVSPRKMEDLVIQVCFSTTKCRCRIQVENRAELLQNLLNSTEYICRGRTSINNSFSHLPESSFHGNLFPIHSPIKCFRFYGHNFQAIRIKKKNQPRLQEMFHINAFFHNAYLWK